MKSKAYFIVIILLSIIIVSVFGYFGCRYIRILSADKTWIKDFGYEENEIHNLTFSWERDRSCPEIPIKIGAVKYNLGFDTGCGAGIFFTNLMEGKINYTILDKVEALNRDGSHRGWEERIHLDEFTVFEDTYKNIETSISDWTMFSSKKFNGTIGLAYFKSKKLTLDYAGHRIAISSNPIDYTLLNSDEYVILPLYRTTSKGQEDLLFFEAELNDESVIVYLDTGKNYSYIFDPDSKSSMADKPTEFLNVPLKIGDMAINLDSVTAVYDIAQAEGLPFPTMIELNSDQIWKCSLLVTLDLIEQKIIFRRL